MKTEHLHHRLHHNHQNLHHRTILTPTNNDRRRILAPRTSEEEALFIAKKYLENKTILEAKLANAVNGGRFLRQNMLDVVASELSAKFNVATRNRKYVEQKLRDMKKEARKYLNMAKSTKVLETGEVVLNCPKTPPSPIRVMMQAMADDHLSFTGADSTSWTEFDFSDTTSKAEGSEGEDEYGIIKSPNNNNNIVNNSDSIASTSSSSSIDMGSLATTNNILGIDTLLGAYFNQPMFAAMANLSNVCNNNNNNNNDNKDESDEIDDKSQTPTPSSIKPPPSTAPSRQQQQQQIRGGGQRRQQIYRIRRRRQTRNRSKMIYPESHHLAAESFRKLCDTMLEIVPRAAKTFEDACKLQSEYFEQLKLQVSLASFASQVHQVNSNFRSLS
uniref:Uncharacterized protein n=1 Tax=Panagrolaimus sp. PS1159 TaxID=55785 RepID=A0AC35GWN1_9BILA